MKNCLKCKKLCVCRECTPTPKSTPMLSSIVRTQTETKVRTFGKQIQKTKLRIKEIDCFRVESDLSHLTEVVVNGVSFRETKQDNIVSCVGSLFVLSDGDLISSLPPTKLRIVNGRKCCSCKDLLHEESLFKFSSFKSFTDNLKTLAGDSLSEDINASYNLAKLEEMDEKTNRIANSLICFECLMTLLNREHGSFIQHLGGFLGIFVKKTFEDPTSCPDDMPMVFDTYLEKYLKERDHCCEGTNVKQILYYHSFIKIMIDNNMFNEEITKDVRGFIFGENVLMTYRTYLRNVISKEIENSLDLFRVNLEKLANKIKNKEEIGKDYRWLNNLVRGKEGFLRNFKAVANRIEREINRNDKMKKEKTIMNVEKEMKLTKMNISGIVREINNI